MTFRDTPSAVHRRAYRIRRLSDWATTRGADAHEHYTEAASRCIHEFTPAASRLLSHLDNNVDIATDLTQVSITFGCHIEHIEVDALSALRTAVNSSEIEDRIRQPRSTMPEGLEKRFSDREFLDLVTFLTSQKKAP